MAEITFEDFEPGAVTEFGDYRVDREAMVAFARRFDPQPFHLDEEAARSTGTGRLIASGWFNCSAQMRMLCDAWIVRSACLGSPGVEKLEWLRPVEAGDVLRCRQTILDARRSRSKPGMGIVRFAIDLGNGRDETVMRTQHLVLIGSRDAEPSPPVSYAIERGAVPPSRDAEPEDPASAPRTFDEVEIGRAVDLGTVSFGADDIISFARDFDPQSFHLSAGGGAAGPFGALAASGWHTGSAWMSRYAARIRRVTEAGGAPRISVSPGWRDLRWLRPVFAGEIIRFATVPVETRPLASRPGWGIVTSRNTGWNAAGDTVIEFTGSAFWARAGHEGPLTLRG